MDASIAIRVVFYLAFSYKPEASLQVDSPGAKKQVFWVGTYTVHVIVVAFYSLFVRASKWAYFT